MPSVHNMEYDLDCWRVKVKNSKKTMVKKHRVEKLRKRWVKTNEHKYNNTKKHKTENKMYLKSLIWNITNDYSFITYTLNRPQTGILEVYHLKVSFRIAFCSQLLQKHFPHALLVQIVEKIYVNRRSYMEKS